MSDKNRVLVGDILPLLHKDVMINVYVLNGNVEMFLLYKEKCKTHDEVKLYDDFKVIKIQPVENDEISLYIKE